MGVDIPADPEPVPWGRGELLSVGKDILIVAIGATVATSLYAAEELP